MQQSTTFMRFFLLCWGTLIASEAYAQSTPTLLRTDNVFIQQRIERSDPEGWLYFKNSSDLTEGVLFSEQKAAAGLSADDGMLLVESEQDEQGFKHNRYQQYYKNIKVEGGEIFEHVRDCYVFLLHGKIIETLNFSAQTTYTQQQALSAALAHIGASQYAWENQDWEQEIKDDTGDPNATYYPTGNLTLTPLPGTTVETSNFRLTWKFEIIAVTPGSHQTIYVNANTGGIVKTIEMRESNGPAVTLYDGTQTIDTKWFGGFHQHHHLESDDSGKKIKTRNGSSANPLGDASWSSYPHIHDSDDVWGADQSNNTSAHWAVNRSWDYFKSTFNRNGMNNANNEVRIFAGSLLTGAFSFNRAGMEHLEFGTSVPFGGTTNFATLDVAGHEFTHGVTRNEAQLGFAGEPGALGESFGDIFGTMVENFQRGGAINWTIAEDAFTLRDMQNPAAFGHPSTFLTDPLWVNVVGCVPVPGPPPAGNDNCGIHSNCGVQNHWFFLLSQGGIQNGVTVQGIGAGKAARIAYSNLCNFLGVNANHPAARLGAIAAARLIYGDCSNEEIQTMNAWAAVGVGAPFVGPCLTLNGDRKLCTDPNYFPYFYIAQAPPGAILTWTFPSTWTGVTEGAGNELLTITSFGTYSPPGGSAFETITVTSSLGGTASIVVKVVDECNYFWCDGGGESKSTGSQAAQKATSIELVKVFPNPARETITVSHPETTVELLTIHTSLGDKMLDLAPSSNLSVIDVSTLKSGVYFITMQLGNETVTKRFVKVN